MNISATEFQNHLSQYLQTSLTEPLIVENQGQKIGVWVGYPEYERLIQAFEDAVWAAQALAAEQAGYLGEESLATLLKMAEEKGVIL